ncbi:MAG: hypothetical protein P4M05_14820 [Bradyrhizobium sp.]|nr:hypothetical protein [Bradyrhizobium sp.]
MAFSSNLLSKKKDRAAFAGGPSQGGNAPGRAATAGVGGHRVSYFASRKIPRIDDAQFSTHVSCFERRPFVLLPITPAGNGHLVPEGMLRQPNRIRNKTISRLRLHFTIEGGYPEIEYD